MRRCWSASCSACRACASRASISRSRRWPRSSSSTGLFVRVKWFTNYAPSGSVAVGRARASSAIPIDTPVETYLFVPGLRRGARAGRQEPGARPHRPHVDGDPRHGHRRRDHRHPAAARQALGLRGQLVLSSASPARCGRSCYLGAVGAAGLRHRPLVPDPVHGHHRRARLDPRLRSSAPPSSCCCRSSSTSCRRLARHPDVDRA